MNVKELKTGWKKASIGKPKGRIFSHPIEIDYYVLGTLAMALDKCILSGKSEWRAQNGTVFEIRLKKEN